MTANQMKDEFLLLYDKVTNFNSPGYTDDEISKFLSIAQERIAKHRYEFQGNKYGDGFEETEKRRKELQGLVQSSVDSTGILKTIVSANQTGKTLPNSVIYELPTDLWLPITEWVVVDKCNEIREVIPITHDEVIFQKDNPFLKPNKRKVWRLDTFKFNDTFRYELITNGDTILEYHVQYLKKLSDIVTGATPVDCELHDLIHRDIVSEAVNIALETAQEQRFNTQSVINNNIE